MPNITPAEQRDKAVVMQLIKVHQQKQLAAVIRKEATRETLRRELLAGEDSKWRREVMKKAFIEERMAAAEEIDKLKLDQERALAAKLKEYGLIR